MNYATSLGCLQSIPDFLKTPDGSRLFGNRNAIEWFNRINRELLICSGALVKIRNHWHLLRPEYDLIVIEIAKSNAKKMVNV